MNYIDYMDYINLERRYNLDHKTFPSNYLLTSFFFVSFHFISVFQIKSTIIIPTFARFKNLTYPDQTSPSRLGFFEKKKKPARHLRTKLLTRHSTVAFTSHRTAPVPHQHRSISFELLKERHLTSIRRVGRFFAWIFGKGREAGERPVSGDRNDDIIISSLSLSLSSSSPHLSHSLPWSWSSP